MKNVKKLCNYNGCDLVELVELVNSLERTRSDEKWFFQCDAHRREKVSFRDVQSNPRYYSYTTDKKDDVLDWIAERDCEFKKFSAEVKFSRHYKIGRVVVIKRTEIE